MAVASSASYSLTVRLPIKSRPGVLTLRDMKRMARDPVVFATANPTPAIRPEEAQRHVRVMAVADGVARAAHATGVARRSRRRQAVAAS